LAATRHFSKVLECDVPESTVRGMKKAYLESLKVKKNPSLVEELPHNPEADH
jgi:hypothetical protein